jgi:SAM-dependent methyltransferase
MRGSDTVFAGSIPELYDRLLGPLLFQPYAEDMARRLADLCAGAVLETAAGTGIVTEQLAATLPETVAITATDLNQPMLDRAAGKPGLARVAFRQADAQALPFPDGAFDAVLCQFGAMFFPDRVGAYREARRVLGTGGRFLFSVWDAIALSPAAEAAVSALAKAFGRPGPWFLERTPHGYHDRDAIARDLQEAGWAGPRIQAITLQGRAASARAAAIGLCQGTPMRAEIEAFGPGALEKGTAAAEAEIAGRFGPGPLEAPMQALVIEATR